jgi:hypothetical protein
MLLGSIVLQDLYWDLQWKRKSAMGYSLHSVGTWIGFISFFAALMAVANAQLQSPFLWQCLGCWAAIVLVYCLVKLIQTVVRIQVRSTGRSERNQGYIQSQGSKSGKPSFKKETAPSHVSLQQRSKTREASFKLPSLAGFGPHGLQAPTSGNAHQKSSTSKGFVSEQLPKAKGEESEFKLPPLAGFGS